MAASLNKHPLSLARHPNLPTLALARKVLVMDFLGLYRYCKPGVLFSVAEQVTIVRYSSMM